MSLLDEAFDALARDLVHENGPQISTMRNYRFAIVPYDPKEEFKLRDHVQGLTTRLKRSGWVVYTLSLQKLLIARIKNLGDDILSRMIELERKSSTVSLDRGMTFLREKLARQIEGPDGIAADVSNAIGRYKAEHPADAERTVVLIGRMGALYPFFRTSSLLKHLGDRTHGLPVVLLYPGTRTDENRLSFMGVCAADGDYRPRIYP
jgi:hypothetical protein